MERYSTIQVLWKDIDDLSTRRKRSTSVANMYIVPQLTLQTKIFYHISHATIVEWNVEEYINSSTFHNILPVSYIFQYSTKVLEQFWGNITEKKNVEDYIKSSKFN